MAHAAITELRPAQFEWPRYWLPYHFRPINVPGKKRTYLPLNRQYKPLDIAPSWPYVNYDDFTISHGIQFARDPLTFKNVWWGDASKGLFLYDDGQPSRDTYFRRLALLCMKKITILAPIPLHAEV